MTDFVRFDKMPEETLGLIQYEVNENIHLFDQFKVRQECPGSDHKCTKTIALRLGKSVRPGMRVEDLTLYAMLNEMEFEDWDNRNLFPEVNEFIEGFMAAQGLTELGWLTVVALGKNSVVTEHRDDGEYCLAFNRYHACIESGHYGSNIINVSYDSYVIDDGDVFTFDNQKLHGAQNRCDWMERIHIIFDAK